MSRMRILIGALCVAASACNGGVTSPTNPGSNFAGEWSGTTSQGVPIAFSVSTDQTVTAITIGHRFSGCTGTNTFPNLTLPIGQSPFPPRVPTPANPVFGFGSGSPEAPNYIQVEGSFTSGQTSTGSATFLNFPNCGNAVASWSATKR